MGLNNNNPGWNPEGAKSTLPTLNWVELIATISHTLILLGELRIILTAFYLPISPPQQLQHLIFGYFTNNFNFVCMFVSRWR